MIKIFGKVPYDNPANGVVSELQDCIDECFYTPDCILSFMDSNNHCLMYNYSTILGLNVTETTRADGLYVAFKINLDPESCPADYKTIVYCGSTETDDYCWDMTSTDWVITNLCPEPWKKFVRDNGVTVCLRSFTVSSAIKKQKATELCESQGYKLTGVASDEESIWMREQVYNYNPERGFWLDGERTPECAASKQCNTFTWTDGYTVGDAALISPYADFSYANAGSIENCLTAWTNRNTTLNDVPCGAYSTKGFFCGFRMIN